MWMEVRPKTHNTPTTPRVFHSAIQAGSHRQRACEIPHPKVCKTHVLMLMLKEKKEKKETIYTTGSRAAGKTAVESEEFLKIFMVILELLLVG